MDTVNAAFEFLANPTHRDILTFLGGAIATVALAGWKIFVYFYEKRLEQPAAPPSSGPDSTSGQGHQDARNDHVSMHPPEVDAPLAGAGEASNVALSSAAPRSPKAAGRRTYLTRRNALQYSVAAIVGGLVTYLISSHKEVPEEVQGRRRTAIADNSKNAPRFRKAARRHFGPVNLPTGFHVNKRSKVAHYIDTLNNYRCTGEIVTKNLINYNDIILDIIKNPNKSFEDAHPNYSFISYSFEEFALQHIRERQYETACGILLLGILYDLKRIGRAKASPSFRLYDLLAGLSARFELGEYLQQMQTQIQIEKQQAHFAGRLTKWSTASGKWMRRWKSTRSQLVWRFPLSHGTVDLYVF